jgi:hypothetical protein
MWYESMSHPNMHFWGEKEKVASLFANLDMDMTCLRSVFG